MELNLVEQLGVKAKEVQPILACADTMQKNDALKAIAAALVERTAEIIEANNIDIVKINLK